MTADPSEALIERVQTLTAQLEEIPDFQARAVADELVSSVIQLYGAGLERIVDALALPGASAADVRERLVEDGVVASLLLIHGLYPVDLETRVLEALESVRPYMESHGGDVELVDIQDGVAQDAAGRPLRGLPGFGGDARAGDQEGARGDGARPRGPRGRGRARAAGAARRFELPVIQPNGNGGSPPPGAWRDMEAAAPAAGTTAPVTVGGRRPARRQCRRDAARLPQRVRLVPGAARRRADDA